jgi:hypothetical protein
MSSKETLQQAIAVYKTGHQVQVRTLLLKYVETDQRSELAWLLLGNLVHDLDDCIIALTINPNNEKSATELWKLKRKRYLDFSQLPNDTSHRLERAIEPRDNGQIKCYNGWCETMTVTDRPGFWCVNYLPIRTAR